MTSAQQNLRVGQHPMNCVFSAKRTGRKTKLKLLSRLSKAVCDQAPVSSPLLTSVSFSVCLALITE